jgi:hypothetical protein
MTNGLALTAGLSGGTAAVATFVPGGQPVAGASAVTAGVSGTAAAVSALADEQIEWRIKMEFLAYCKCDKQTGKYSLWVEYRGPGREKLNAHGDEDEIYDKIGWGYAKP